MREFEFFQTHVCAAVRIIGHGSAFNGNLYRLRMLVAVRVFPSETHVGRARRNRFDLSAVYYYGIFVTRTPFKMREIGIVKFAVYGGVFVPRYNFGEVCGLSGTKRKFAFFECKRIGVCSRERNIAHARIERIIVYCKHHAVGYIRLFDALHIVGNFNRYRRLASAHVLI